MKIFFVLLLLTISSTYSHIARAREDVVAYFHEVLGDSFVVNPDCLADHVEDDFKAIVAALKRGDWQTAWQSLKTLLEQQKTSCQLQK